MTDPPPSTIAPRGPLVALAEIDQPARLGGKGAPLAALLRAGLPVPPAWALPTDWLEAQLDRLGVAALAAEVEARLADGARAPAARRLRSALLTGALPDEVAAALAHRLAQLRRRRHPSLAVRSSATVEGLPGASFAGQFQTFLDVQNAEQAGAAVRSCWASLWSASALQYRAAHRLASAPGLAVLLQVFIPAEAAGAARVEAGGVEVESAWGLGPVVLSGLVAPDRYRFDPAGRLLDVTPGHKPVRAVAEGGSLAWRPVPAEQQARPSLDRSTAAAVARLALRAAATLGRPLEVEWALHRRRVWLLQARLAVASEPARAAPAESPPAGGGLRGIPAAPGAVVGPVRLVERPDDLEAVGPGDVVVARYLGAALAARFRGAGIVTEMGGSTAHAVAIARERRIPMVTGLLGATRRLLDGQLVRLDGSRGLVEPLAPPADRPGEAGPSP